MRISTAAELVGVPSHVLRHWEDEGVLVPDRTGANQREFSAQHVDEARIILRLRRAGVGLPDIREMRGAGRQRRVAVLAAAAARLSVEAERAGSAAAFLRHTSECRHPVIAECAECGAYASGPR